MASAWPGVGWLWAGLAVLARLYVVLVLAFLLAPVGIIVVTSLSSARTVQFPPPGVSLQWYVRFWDHLREAPGTKPRLLEAILTSAGVGAAAAGVTVVVGVLAGYALARGGWRGRELVRQLFVLPLLFPQIVIGIGLLVLFSTLRALSPLQRLVVGHATICLPYVLLIVAANLELYDRSVEEAALGLGAGPVRTFARVTLPLIRPGLVAAGLFAFIVSFTNFTVTFFLTGGGAKPLPLWLFEVVEFYLDPVLAVTSVFLILMTIGAALLLDRLLGIRRLLRS
jgi:putative spermidine/putrescine transport system permease protein